jgi:hypothetical protein
MPENEAALVSIVERYRRAFDAAPNGMAQGALRPERATEICVVIPRTPVRNWIGTVSSLSATNDGRGVLQVTISQNLSVSTASTAFSDGVEGFSTLIRTGSQLHQSAVALKIGQKIVFSGSFARQSDDCLLESSLSVRGAMTSPNFRFQFSDIRPAQ